MMKMRCWKDRSENTVQLNLVQVGLFRISRLKKKQDILSRLQVNMLLQFQAEYNISKKATVQMAKSHNAIPGSEILLPLNNLQLQKQAVMRYEYEYYVLCHKCRELTTYKTKCVKCNVITKQAEDNFIAIVPVKQQIKLSLQRNFDRIIEFLNEDRGNGMMNDVYDGLVFQKIKLSFPHETVLSLTLNLDGASVSNSSKSSIWPILLYQNYLPPKMRFMKENIFCEKARFVEIDSSISQ